MGVSFEGTFLATGFKANQRNTSIGDKPEGAFAVSASKARDVSTWSMSMGAFDLGIEGTHL